MPRSIRAALTALGVLLSSASATGAGCTFDFYPEVTYGAGTKAGDVAAGDFNNDGFDDLAVVNRQSVFIAILLGRPDGTFADKIFTATTGANQGDILAAHMDGDSNLDLVVMGGAGGTHVQVLLGTGSGGFRAGDSELVGATPYHLAAADFDDDGDTDIAVTRSGTSAGFHLLLNSGGVLTPKSVITPSGTTAIDGIGAGDIDGDGKIDVAITSVDQNKIWSYFGVGDGTFTAGPILSPERYGAALGPSAIAVADLNDDGAGDLVIANRSIPGTAFATNDIVLSNGSSRTFGQARGHGYRTGQSPPDLLVHDVNGDGRLDILVAADSHVYFYRGLGDYFPEQLRYGSGGTGLAVLDVDDDGGADLAATHYAAGTVGILQNVCGAVTIDFTSSANPQTGGTPVTITATISSKTPATGTLVITDFGSTPFASIDVATSSTASFTITLGVATYEFTATYSGDASHSKSSRTLLQVMNPAPFGPPPGLTATHYGGITQVSWIPTAGTSRYEVFRNTGSGYQFLGTTSEVGYYAYYFDNTAPFNSAILYKVRAISPSSVASAFSAPDLATTYYFEDHPVYPRFNRVKRVHLTDLRAAANGARALAGLPAATWTDAVPTVIRAVHINELRTAINQARTAMGFAAIAFTDPTVTNTHPIRASHINEPRDALR